MNTSAADAPGPHLRVCSAQQSLTIGQSPKLELSRDEVILAKRRSPNPTQRPTEV